MRKPIIAGNWKMNTTLVEAKELASKIKIGVDKIKGVEKVICPPFISLSAVAEILKGSTISPGAQNLFYEEKGAYTGEISPAMLVGYCKYVIIGHSERRAYFHEDDILINKKVKAALKVGLWPILCVGENLEERNSGVAEEVVVGQLRQDIQDIKDVDRNTLVLAYEPVWAIGTGKSATGAQAEEMSAILRNTIARIMGSEIAENICILYGGSVNSSNISDFISQADIDGALVGGASLKAEEFTGIIKETNHIKGIR